jgi:dipeptidyl aminopeptidase/acylaminoacyl peptidase
VLLTDVRTGATRTLAGGASGAAWAPVWSPDGRRLAFYADRDGRARLWVWDRDRDALRRVSHALVRPYFGFEQPRWSPDGRRLLVKLLPEGLTLDAAAALLSPPPEARPTTRRAGRDVVTARVYSTLPESTHPETSTTRTGSGGGGRRRPRALVHERRAGRPRARGRG